MSSPLSTPYTCRKCGAMVIRDTWTATTADHEGDPVERIGTAHYCSNEACVFSQSPLEDEDMQSDDEKENESVPF